MAVFMARGYKGPFHTHVSQSLANYFSEQTKDEIRAIVEGCDDETAAAVDSLLETETVTAWGAQSELKHDRELFEQLSQGDHFLMRTARPTQIKYIQQVDLRLAEDTSQEVREAISEAIWGDQNYDLLWFSETPVMTTSISQADFEEYIQQVDSDFEFADWFPSQRRNFARIPNDILSDLGGEDAFLEHLMEYDGGKLTPGVDNYFILNTADNALDVDAEHRFDFKKTTTDLADEMLNAENNGRVLLCDLESIYATARIGNIEGTRRNGSLHKVVTLLDWQDLEPVGHEDILDELSVSIQYSADGMSPPVPAQNPIARCTETDYQTVLKRTEVQTDLNDRNEEREQELPREPGEDCVEPQLFLMPVNREEWLDEFKRTVDQPFSCGPPEERPSGLTEYESIRVWGTRPGERNTVQWNQMSAGDIVLFYSEGWFFAGGRVGETIRSTEASTYIWDDEDGGLIYTLTDYQRVALPRSTVWDWVGYEDNHVPQGLTHVYPDRVSDIRDEVDDLWAHIIDYAVDAPVDTILDGDVRPNTTDTQAYFILRTGGGNYDDTPAEEYHFKEGIPGSKQLRTAANNAQIVYLEDGEFYATGRVGDIQTEDRDGTTHYFASIEDYDELTPISLADIEPDLETSFPIQYGIIKVPQADYETILSAADEPMFEPIAYHETVMEATSTITSRLERLPGGQRDWMANQITATVLDDWTTAVDSFDADDPVPPARETTYAQLRALWRKSESKLTDLASQLKTGRLESLSPSQTLFVVFLRQLQNQYNCRPRFTPETIHQVLREEYEVATDLTTPSESPSNPLSAYLEANPDVMVHRFSAPPEYWLTSAAMGLISFERTDEDDWDSIDPGDVVLWYCQQTGLEIEGEVGHGFIGAGIVRTRTTKLSDRDWWWDEFREGVSFPLVVAFDTIYLTGDAERLPDTNPIDNTTNPAALTDWFAALTANPLTFSDANHRCQQETGRGVSVSSTYDPFRSEGGEDPDHDRPNVIFRAMAERGTFTAIPPVELTGEITATLDPDTILDGLHFEDSRGEDLIAQTESALRAGKHIIFTGPPGTGKTELARRIAADLVDSAPNLYTASQMTTATADWSTFDTVGGYMPDESDADTDDGEGLTFSPGVVLNRFKGRQPAIQRNDLLIIDELNRADIDKAFGQLFTVLSGQTVQLPYLKDGTEIELRTASTLDGLPATYQYVVPKSWRIFATMNTYDKTSLYEMSYAFMRRFAFLRVDVPPIPEDPEALDALMQRYISEWEDLEATTAERVAVGRVWQATNQAVEQRSIGPAIIEDMLRFVTDGENNLERRVTQAVISFVFPQLEGVPKRREICSAIAAVDRVDLSELEAAARDMLQIEALDTDR